MSRYASSQEGNGSLRSILRSSPRDLVLILSEGGGSLLAFDMEVSNL